MDFRRSRNFLDNRYYLCDNLRQGHRFGLTARLKKSRNRQGFCPACFLKFIRFQIAGFFGHFIFSVLPRRLSQLHFSPIEISVHIVEKKGGKQATTDMQLKSVLRRAPIKLSVRRRLRRIREHKTRFFLQSDRLRQSSSSRKRYSVSDSRY